MSIAQCFPTHVEWQLTAACDLRCAHCNARGATGSGLPTRDALSLVDKLAEGGVRAVTLSGGEPFLRNDWHRVATALATVGIDTQIISNGQHITASTAAQLSRSRVSRVWLSVDGDETVHDTVRRKAGALQRLRESAAHLVNAKVPLGAMTTALATNAGQLNAIGADVFRMGAQRWQVWLGNPCNGENIWLSPSQARAVARTLLSLRRSFPNLIIGDNVGYGGELERLRHPEDASQANAGFRFTGCYAADRVLAITHSGALRGCLAMPGPGAPLSLFEDALARVRSQVHQERVRQLQRCRGCALITTCNGGCLAHGMAVSSMGRRSCYVAAAPRGLPAVAAASVFAMVTCASGCQPVDGAPKEPPAAPGETNQPATPNAPVPTLTTPSPAEPAASSSPVKKQKRTMQSETQLPANADRVKGLHPAPDSQPSMQNGIGPLPCMMSHVGCDDNLPAVMLEPSDGGEAD